MKPPSILVVDDDDLERLLLEDTLSRAFHNSRIALVKDPEDAVAFCKTQKPDCVLIDYNMPSMDGLELGSAIRAECPHIPLVLMTAVGDEMLAAAAIQKGFADYVPKSRINSDSAQRIVERAIRSMEQARRIEEQREELEHFAYALSHDFRQPIRQICTFSDLLEQQIAPTAGEDVLSNLYFLRDAARRLGALVEVMSQYTLLNKAPELKAVDIDEVARGVRVSLDGYIAERKGAFIAEPTGLMVHGNSALLAQVLQNLVINGLRYNRSPTPQVTLTVESLRNGTRRLRVRDNGIGIEESYIEKIFKPLVRLHAETEFPGTGLGLTIARKALLAQGGTIRCVSEPGHGSEFIIEMSKEVSTPEIAPTESVWAA